MQSSTELARPITQRAGLVRQIALRGGGLAALVVFLVLLGLDIQSNGYHASVAFQICFWAVAGMAYNISAGYAGDLSLGHGAFLGIGAYTSSLMFVDRGLSPWLGVLAGMFLAAVLAVVLGVVAVRLRGPYFAIVTLAVVLVLNLLASGWTSLTEGDIGMSITGRESMANMLYRKPASYVLVAFALAVVVTLLCRWLYRSRLGFQLAAYHENEDAARSLGIATTRVRVIALVISAIVTAAAGSVQAQYLRFVSPSSEFSLTFSVQVAVIAIIGGLGTVYGPMLGAILVVILAQALAPLVQHAAGLDQVIYGGILIIVLLFFRGGLAGVGAWAIKSWRRRRGSSVATAGLP